jgi:DNA replication protein DnaC
MMSNNSHSQNPQPVPQLSDGQLEPLFRRLNLAHTRRVYQAVADRAEKENWTYRDFLAVLLAEEVAHRKQTRLQRFTRKADFPFFKTIDEFDFTLQSTLKQSLLGSYLGPDFITEGRSLIFYGKAGRGKTHLAVAIGYRAIQNGYETLCTTAAELIEDLSNASKTGQLQDALLTYTHPHVLVVDELGYLTYGADAANVLFHVVNDRHLKKRPMIFTTNKPLSEWGKVLHDEDLAAAILDRVLERGRFIPLDGSSGRTRHLNLEGILPATANSERLRISGINGSEFPEPTTYCDSIEVSTSPFRKTPTPRPCFGAKSVPSCNGLAGKLASALLCLRARRIIRCQRSRPFGMRERSPLGAEVPSVQDLGLQITQSCFSAQRN